MPPVLSDNEGSDVGEDIRMQLKENSPSPNGDNDGTPSRRSNESSDVYDGPGDNEDQDDQSEDDKDEDEKNENENENDKGEDEDEDEKDKDEKDKDEKDKDDESKDDDDEADEEVYVVEKIINHMIDGKNKIKFHVKWEGYSKKSDMTWEPEENLTDNATEVLQDYYDTIGGREAAFAQTTAAKGSKKRGRPSKGTGAPAAAKRSKSSRSHPADSTPPATKKWSPPSGSWEDDIESVDACEEEKSGKLIVFLNWKDGHKTKHETAVVYKKCPQKMLAFYEQHVRIIREENQILRDES